MRVRAHLLWRKCHAQNNTDSFGRCTLRRSPCFSSNVRRFRRSGGVNRQSRYRKRRSFDSPLLRVLSPSPSPSLLVALWPSPLPLVMKGAQVRRAVKVTVYTTDHSSRPSIFIAEQFFSRRWLDLRCNRHVRFGSKADMCGAQANVRFVPIATSSAFRPMSRVGSRATLTASRLYWRSMRCRNDRAVW